MAGQGWGSLANDDGNLERALRRQAAINEVVAFERIKKRKRDSRNHRKLVAIVGAALLDQAAKSADFELMIKGILKTAVTEDSARRFLGLLGWM